MGGKVDCISSIRCHYFTYNLYKNLRLGLIWQCYLGLLFSPDWLSLCRQEKHFVSYPLFTTLKLPSASITFCCFSRVFCVVFFWGVGVAFLWIFTEGRKFYNCISYVTKIVDMIIFKLLIRKPKLCKSGWFAKDQAASKC